MLRASPQGLRLAAAIAQKQLTCCLSLTFSLYAGPFFQYVHRVRKVSLYDRYLITCIPRLNEKPASTPSRQRSGHAEETRRGRQ